MLWIFLRPRCCSEWRFTLLVGYTAKLDLYTSDRPCSGGQLSGHLNVLFSVLFLCFCSGSVRKVLRVCLCYRKDVLD